MSEHTTGPWCVIGSHVYQVEEVGGRGVLHGGSVKGATTEEREANIRLIAAAPELLEALWVLLGGIDEATFIAEERGEETYLPPDMDCIVAAEQAITKAKGESNATHQG